eukprot:1195448-Prorocentrum_minimum.AAC.9
MHVVYQRRYVDKDSPAFDVFSHHLFGHRATREKTWDDVGITGFHRFRVSTRCAFMDQAEECTVVLLRVVKSSISSSRLCSSVWTSNPTWTHPVQNVIPHQQHCTYPHELDHTVPLKRAAITSNNSIYLFNMNLLSGTHSQHACPTMVFMRSDAVGCLVGHIVAGFAQVSKR